MKEIIITKEEQKAIKEMLNGCAGYIVLSNKGNAVNCSMPMLMTLITNLLEDLYKKNKINDILLDDMIKIVSYCEGSITMTAKDGTIIPLTMDDISK